MPIRPPIGLGARHPGVLMEITNRASDFDRVVDGDVWEKVANVRVAFTQATGREAIEQQEVIERYYEVGWIRYPGFRVTTAMRLWCRDEYWEITAAVDIEGRHRWVKLNLVRTEDIVISPL